MSLTTKTRSMVGAIDEASPAQLADRFRAIKLGTTVRCLPTYLRSKVPVATGTGAGQNPYVHSTVTSLILPDDAKAARVLRATVLAVSGGSVLEELTDVAIGTTPSTTNVAVAPNGDIVFLASDDATIVDVIYLPERMDIYEVTTTAIASGIVNIADVISGGPKGILLMEAEVLAGSVTGKCEILVPAASVPATTKAALKHDRTKVFFNSSTDAPTQVRFKIGVVPAVDIDSVLETSQNF